MVNFRFFKSFLRISFQDHLTYKGMLAVWMFEIFFLPLTILFVWRSIASSSTQLQDNIGVITNYYLLLPLIILYTSAWHGPYLSRSIRLGHINKNLIKPYPILTQFLASNFSSKLIKSIFLLPLVVLSTTLFSIQIELDTWQLLLFTISLISTWILTFFRDSLTGFLAFWFDQTSSVNEFMAIFEFTLGGRLVPIFFFPPLIKTISTILPFRYFTVFPLEILTRTLTPPEIFLGFVVQALWVLVFVVTTKILWVKGIKKYSAFGG
jgi:ABC-2 type transport system permease protein